MFCSWVKRVCGLCLLCFTWRATRVQKNMVQHVRNPLPASPRLKSTMLVLSLSRHVSAWRHHKAGRERGTEKWASVILDNKEEKSANSAVNETGMKGLCMESGVKLLSGITIHTSRSKHTCKRGAPPLSCLSCVTPVSFWLFSRSRKKKKKKVGPPWFKA